LTSYEFIYSLPFFSAVKALFTLSVMGVTGKKLLNPIFYYVAKSKSHEAFLSIILTTVLLMSFVTQGQLYYCCPFEYLIV
jgi:Kef-type K+ transport system membrane component KefB